MSSAGRWLAGLLVLAAGPLAARPVPPDTSLAVAVAQYARLAREQRLRDSIRSRRGEEDTVRVGALRILTLPEVAVNVRAAARRADAELAERYASAVRVLDGTLFRIVAERDGREWQVVALSDNGGAMSRGGLRSPDEVTTVLVALAEQAIWQAADPALRAWLPTSLEEVRDSARFRRLVYYELALSPSVVARGCLVRDVGACEEALALAPVSEPLTRWYDAAGRRGLVVRLGARWDWGPRQLEHYACIEERDDAACTSLLVAVGRAEGRSAAEARAWDEAVIPVPPPLGERSRLLLLQVTTALGGDGAWTRLTARPGDPISDRFRAAAAVPGDSLVRAWRSLVESWRPPPIVLPGGLVGTSILWIGAVTVLSCWGLRWR